MPPVRRRPTKAEIRERQVRDALAWPPDPPAPMSPDEMAARVREEGVVRAWTYNAHARRVSYGSFDAYNHNDAGPMVSRHHCSKGQGGPWFAERADACLALRHAATREAALQLDALDAMISGVLAAPDPSRPEDDAEATPGPRP